VRICSPRPQSPPAARGAATARRSRQHSTQNDSKYLLISAPASLIAPQRRGTRVNEADLAARREYAPSTCSMRRAMTSIKPSRASQRPPCEASEALEGEKRPRAAGCARLHGRQRGGARCASFPPITYTAHSPPRAATKASRATQRSLARAISFARAGKYHAAENRVPSPCEFSGSRSHGVARSSRCATPPVTREGANSRPCGCTSTSPSRPRRLARRRVPSGGT
jgi:hypothetical protein